MTNTLAYYDTVTIVKCFILQVRGLVFIVILNFFAKREVAWFEEKVPIFFGGNEKIIITVTRFGDYLPIGLLLEGHDDFFNLN